MFLLKVESIVQGVEINSMMVRVVWMLVLSAVVVGHFRCLAEARPRRILMDTDVNMDDIFALFYVLKQNRSEFDLQVSPIFFFPRNLNLFSFFSKCVETHKIGLIF